MDTAIESESELENCTFLSHDQSEHALLMCSKSSRLLAPHLEPASMDPVSCHACDHHASPPPAQFRIRLATYGVSIIIVLGICSVPVLLVGCFGEKHGELFDLLG